MASQDQVHTSAPGKVLLTGGYLVLDPQYSGIVLATNARFHSIVSIHPPTKDNSKNTDFIIEVHAEQFVDGFWRYRLLFPESLSTNSFIQIEDLESRQTKNLYLEILLKITFSIIHQRKPDAFQEIINLMEGGSSPILHITLKADNDFYSQRHELSRRNLPFHSNSLRSLPKYIHTSERLHLVHKTGLGSSAAMMVSLVAALLLFFKVIVVSEESDQHMSVLDLQFIDRLTQYIHCLAQGKIGSGFDVSTAVFGSQVYQRFDPSILTDVINLDLCTPSRLLQVLHSNDQWHHLVTPFYLPTGLSLILADIDVGSSTPGMVSTVLNWRKNHSEKAAEIWSDIATNNQKIQQSLEKLIYSFQQNELTYFNTLSKLSKLMVDDWKGMHDPNMKIQVIIDAICDLSDCFESNRDRFRLLTQLSSAPIEPVEQTRLLDTSKKCPGTIAVGIPGAGGYDALFCLIIKNPETEEALEKVWSEYSQLSVLRMITECASEGLLFHS